MNNRTMSIALAQQTAFNLDEGTIKGADHTERKLSDLKGFFADEEAYNQALTEDDPVIYTVQSINPANGEGDLSYGMGTLMPGKIGNEYYLTKGHFHSWREASEVYICLEGNGMMVLEEEESGETKTFRFEMNDIVYVPGYTAHRTINCGDAPLKYLGIYPSAAGHDYGAIATQNFKSVIAEIHGELKVVDRDSYLEEYI